MIALFVKIPFHAQLKRADPGLIAEVAAEVGSVAEVFRSRLHPTDESFFLLFDEAEGCALLRSTEAARSLEARLRVLGPRLHGWTILLEVMPAGQGPDDALREVRRRWQRIEADGLYVAPGASPAFQDYLDLEPGEEERRVAAFPYALPVLPGSYHAPEPAAPSLERFIDEAGSHLIGEAGADLLVAVGPGSVPSDYLEAALRTLYKDKAGAFLWAHGSVGEGSPYGPLLRALGPGALPGADAALALPERTELERLWPVAEFLASSPYRRTYSATLRTRIRLYVALMLRAYARTMAAAALPAVLVLGEIDRFPRESLDLIADLLAEVAAAEGLVAFATSQATPEKLGSLSLKVVAAPPPSPVAIAQAAIAACRDAIPGRPGLGDLSPRPAEGLGPSLAAAAEGDPFRLGLALRLSATKGLPGRRLSTLELASLALGTLPEDFAEVLLALSLAEDVLDARRLEDFLGAAGFVPGLRPLLFGQLGSLGFVASGQPPRLLRKEAGLAAEAVAPEEGRRVTRCFQSRLVALQAGRSIGSSEALFYRVREALPSSSAAALFYLDCLSADGVYGISPGAGGEGGALPPLEGLRDFVAAYGAGDTEGTVAALAAMDAGAARPGAHPLEVALASLCKAFDDYARGQAAMAASRAKPALIGLHALGARRAEARAHRLLGLSALAQSQVQDGADYLANAYELAEEVPDPLECILAAYGEAGAQFVLGDLRRAGLRGEAARTWALSSFRSDWEAAADFLSGRIALELGRHEAAVEAFSRVRASARVYDQPEAATRAEIWSGRARAYGGAGAAAREILDRHPTDPEALWFLAELAFFEGEPGEAASLASRALDRLEAPGYRPADLPPWATGFEGIEARALGYGGGRSFLEDQIGAFAAFTAGLRDGSPDRVLEIASRTREERLAALHPQAHVYHYYCYRNLQAASGGPLDAATVLSKAFKALQTRTARMDEAALKDEYLEGNRWSREILAEARRHKLI